MDLSECTWLTYSSDAAGNRASIAYPAGNGTAYAYDTLNRLIELTHTDPVGALQARFTYTLGPADNRLQIVEADNRTTAYTYDVTYKLLSETVSDGALAVSYDAQYTYDQVGNRLTRTRHGGDEVTSYVYDANDRLSSETVSVISQAQSTETTYAYDANGNTTQKDDSVTTTTYTWTPENQLAGLTDVANADGVTQQTVSYAYDDQGMRVGKSVDGVATTFLLDKNRDYAQVLVEYAPGSAFAVNGGGADVHYVYGDDLISQERVAGTQFYLYDGLGSTRALADEAGSVTDTYAYEAFGELAASTGVSENRYLYTGEQIDPNAGFYYLRARYYDQGVGRFLAADAFPGSSRVPGSLHDFAYVHNDPANFADPSGYLRADGIIADLLIRGTLHSVVKTTAAVQFQRAIFLGLLTAGYTAIAAAPEVAKQQFVEHCVKGAGTDARCKTKSDLPVFVLGRDVRAHAKLVERAQSSGIPSVLTRRAINHSRSFTRRAKECVGRTGLGTGLDCDEYPYSITAEGGGANYRAHMVRLEPIPLSVNRSSGGKLGQFMRGCRVRANTNRARFAVVPLVESPRTAGFNRKGRCY